MIKSVTLIGAGNLATQLGKALQGVGIDIVQVYSRTRTSACELGAILKIGFTHDPKEIRTDSDLLIISVKDDAIQELLERIDVGKSFIIHTAGSIPMEILATYSDSFGVLYPLQTFSKKRNVDFLEIPICLEANTPERLNQLKGLASRLSNQVVEISSDERKVLHLAAVFTCNFVNHFYVLGDQLLAQKQLSFDLLRPLIKETAAKALSMSPFDVQTGPAVRFDETIINKHLKMLDNHPELRKIYSFVSESIHELHKK